MSRQNIFDILSENFDVKQEVQNIWILFKDIIVFDAEKENFRDKCGRTILDCVDKYTFSTWKSRNQCISSMDMMERLGIHGNKILYINKFCSELLVFLEFCINMIKRCDIAIEKGNAYYTNNYQILCKNIENLIEHFGHMVYYDEDLEQVTIVEKNQASMEAAEISEPSIAKKVIQYNHYTLKGNIDLKKGIILVLANELEPQRSNLEKASASVASDVFFLLNSMNLRHNNIDPSSKHFKQFVSEMSGNELEYWYDETYQLILLAKLLLDNDERQKRIKKMKNIING